METKAASNVHITGDKKMNDKLPYNTSLAVVRENGKTFLRIVTDIEIPDDYNDYVCNPNDDIHCEWK